MKNSAQTENELDSTSLVYEAKESIIKKMRKNFRTVSELPPTSPRKPLPTLPNLLKSSNNNGSKLLPTSPRGQQTFVAISTDEEELISLLSMEGTKVFVIGLWDETSPLLSNNSSNATTTTGNSSTIGTTRRVPPPLPPKTTLNNRRLSKICFDTTCFISEDGKALVCESDLPSSGPLGMQKRSNSMLLLISHAY